MASKRKEKEKMFIKIMREKKYNEIIDRHLDRIEYWQEKARTLEATRITLESKYKDEHDMRSSVVSDLMAMQTKYEALKKGYQVLQDVYDSLRDSRQILLTKYIDLKAEYDALKKEWDRWTDRDERGRFVKNE